MNRLFSKLGLHEKIRNFEIDSLPSLESKPNELVKKVGEKEGQKTYFERQMEFPKRSNRTVALAESMTGGAVSAALVQVPDASLYYLGGVVSYSESSKIALLDVPENLLREKGAVSAEVALTMARGVRKRFQSDIAISVTGFAGPKGDRVGEVFVGVVFQEKEECEKLNFQGLTRKQIIQATVDFVVKKIEFLLLANS